MIVTLLIVTVLGAITVLSLCIEPWMPSFTIKGQVASYQSLQPLMLLAPLCLIPLVLIGSLLFRKHTFLSRILPVILFMQLIPLMAWLDRHEMTATVLSWISVVLILGTWTAYIAVLRFTCMRRCLAG